VPASSATKYLKHPLATSVASAMVSTLLTLFLATKPTFDESARRAVSNAVAGQSIEISKLAGSANGFIVGEIRTFAFDGEPFEGTNYRQILDDLQNVGWVECRGQAMPKRVYPDLYSRVGGRWGRIDDETVRFPDFRGVFLRGWNHFASVSDFVGDPDITDRESSVSGQERDRVGSSQPPAIQLHTHVEFATNPGASIPGSSPQFIGKNATDATKAQSGPPAPESVKTSRFETRPKNKYVLYCIYTGPRMENHYHRSPS